MNKNLGRENIEKQGGETVGDDQRSYQELWKEYIEVARRNKSQKNGGNLGQVKGALADYYRQVSKFIR